MSKQDQQPEIPEWAQATESIELPPEALEKIQQIIDNPPEPSERMRAAAKRHQAAIERQRGK